MNRLARRAATLATAGLLTAGSLGLAANVASASSAPTEHFQVVIVDGQPSTSGILWGPITGGATSVQHDQYDVVRLPHGTFRLNHPDSSGTFSFHYDHTTCFATLHETGTYTISNGTGNYAGISGSGSYNGYGHAVLKRTGSGACDPQSEPSAGIFIISGHGPIHV